jgi:hypothetical protein
MLLLQHLTPLAHKQQAGVPKDRGGRGGEDGVANSVATTHLRHHGDGSRFSRILTVSNDLSFVGADAFPLVTIFGVAMHLGDSRTHIGSKTV